MSLQRAKERGRERERENGEEGRDIHNLWDRDGAPDVDQRCACGTHRVRPHCGEGDRTARLGRQRATLRGNKKGAGNVQTPRGTETFGRIPRKQQAVGLSIMFCAPFQRFARVLYVHFVRSKPFFLPTDIQPI